MIDITSRCTSGDGVTRSTPAAAAARGIRTREQRAVGGEQAEPGQPGHGPACGGDRLGDGVEHLDRDRGPHLVDPHHRRVARDGDEARAGALERHGIRDQHRLGALPVPEEERRPVGDAAVLPHDEVDVVLVAVGVGQLDDARHEVHGRGRAEPAEHPDRLVAPDRHAGGRHRATKCLRNLRTWFTW